MPNDDGTGRYAHQKRNRDLFNYLANTFSAMLPQEAAGRFREVISELERAVMQNCSACAKLSDLPVGIVSIRQPLDPRRSRFLLRLVSARVSHLFVGEAAIFPKTVVEGLDRYLLKALGEIIYRELNNEGQDLFRKIATDDDKEICERIQGNVDWRRFADTILIRILLKFENFQAGKRVFMSVIGMAMGATGNFQFKDGHFHILWEALFGDVAKSIANEEQRLYWDYQFGEGTSQKLQKVFANAKSDKAPPRAASRGGRGAR